MGFTNTRKDNSLMNHQISSGGSHSAALTDLDIPRSYCNNELLEEDALYRGSATPLENKKESSGDDHWIVSIKQPKRLSPYEVECEDLIEHFQMSFQEGEAFKALWSNGQMRIGKGKPGDSPLRNAEKVAHFGQRMKVMEGVKIANAQT